ncbi:MAG: hypothetical protein GXN93_04435 [Candidatus Diapherotrites archaeon]|nr:hypothetical protein [Candidatus Diapherotrites archaeon]
MPKKEKKQTDTTTQETAQKPTADELLSQTIHDFHYEVKGIKNYFSNVYDAVKYYLDKYGPYLPTEDRKKLALLAFKADEIMLDVYGLAYQIDIIYGEAQASIDRGEPETFHVEDEFVGQLRDAINSVEEAIDSFVDEFKAMIAEFRKKAEKDGMY